MLLDCLRSGWYKYDALNKQGVYDNITKHIMFILFFMSVTFLFTRFIYQTKRDGIETCCHAPNVFN